MNTPRIFSTLDEVIPADEQQVITRAMTERGIAEVYVKSIDEHNIFLMDENDRVILCCDRDDMEVVDIIFNVKQPTTI